MSEIACRGRQWSGPRCRQLASWRCCGSFSVKFIHPGPPPGVCPGHDVAFLKAKHTPLWASIWHAWSDLRHLAQTAGLVAASSIAIAAWPPLRHASRIAQSLSPHGCTGLSAASALQLMHAVATRPQPASGGSIPVGQLPAGGNFCALQVGCSCSAHRGSCALMDHTAVACLASPASSCPQTLAPCRPASGV